MGAGYGGQSAHGLQPLLWAKRQEEDLTELLARLGHHPGSKVPGGASYRFKNFRRSSYFGGRTRMKAQRLLYTIDGISTWTGKAASWLIIGLMTLVCVEVFKRYIMNMPTAW